MLQKALFRNKKNLRFFSENPTEDSFNEITSHSLQVTYMWYPSLTEIRQCLEFDAGLTEFRGSPGSAKLASRASFSNQTTSIATSAGVMPGMRAA